MAGAQGTSPSPTPQGLSGTGQLSPTAPHPPTIVSRCVCYTLPSANTYFLLHRDGRDESQSSEEIGLARWEGLDEHPEWAGQSHYYYSPPNPNNLIYSLF